MPEWVKILGIIAAILMSAYNVLKERSNAKELDEGTSFRGLQTTTITASETPFSFEAS